MLVNGKCSLLACIASKQTEMERLFLALVRTKLIKTANRLTCQVECAEVVDFNTVLVIMLQLFYIAAALLA